MAEEIDRIPREDDVTLSGPDERGMRRCAFFAFNTTVAIDAKTRDDAPLRALVASCRRYERLFSRTLPHSDISRVNDACGKPVPVARETFELISQALRYCAASEGLFDITIGAASRLWDFRRGRIPDDGALREAVRHVGWENIELVGDENGGGAEPLLRLRDPEASIDVGGIAKGWIADRLADQLRSRGVASALVNLGGNVYALGRRPDGRAWAIGIQDPMRPGAFVDTVGLEDASAVTSGVYERSFMRGNTLYHHILHPRTGQPVATDAAGVTVIARRSIDAEGFSTVLLAMGCRRGIAFASSRPEIERAVFVDASGRLHSTS